MPTASPSPPLPDYRCPGCNTLSGLVIGPTQALCTNEGDCRVFMFDPSLPDGGLSQASVINLDGYTSQPSAPAQPTITCPRCRHTSSNRNDIREGYCGRCHDWTATSPPGGSST